MPRTLMARPSAKINLSLRVGDRRQDGYHDVRTVLQSISVFDTLTFSARRGPFVLVCRAPGVPADPTNLVWKAAAALWTAAGRPGEPRDAHVKIDKKIPTQAGLGGGSADAAAALVALNDLWECRLPRRELLALAATLGADVPFFLVGGTALGVGRGEELYALDDIGRLGVILLKPSFGVATKDAYRWLDEGRAARSTPAAEAGPTPGAAVARAVEVGWPTGPLTLWNDLEPPVSSRHPEIATLVDACLREGALASAMSGSGSAVFGLFPESVASRAVRRLRQPDRLVLLARTLTRREAGRRLGL